MQFTIGTITRCSGQQHYQVPVTIQGEVYTLHTTPGEVAELAPGTLAERREAILQRLRSEIKERGAVTFAQVKAALEGQTFVV